MSAFKKDMFFDVHIQTFFVVLMLSFIMMKQEISLSSVKFSELFFDAY